MNHTERLAFTEGIFEQCTAEPWANVPEKYMNWLSAFNGYIGQISGWIRAQPGKPDIPIALIRTTVNHCLTLVSMVADDTGEPAPDVLGDCLHIMRTKGLSYASEQDASRNFTNNAAAAGVTKYVVCLIFLLKHVESVRNSIVNAHGGVPTTADGESIFGRVADIINYAVLLAMMVQDDERAVGDAIMHTGESGHVTFDASHFAVHTSKAVPKDSFVLVPNIETDPQAYRDALKKVPISDVERAFGEPMGNGRKKKKKSATA